MTTQPTPVKSFEYKPANLKKGNWFTVRTKGIELKESASIVCHHKESITGKFNVYSVKKSALDRLLDEYWEFKPQFNWND